MDAKHSVVTDTGTTCVSPCQWCLKKGERERSTYRGGVGLVLNGADVSLIG